jgi:drug/metabolite transporter (DMT)-like permease
MFPAITGRNVPTALFASGIPKIGAGVSSILMTVELPVAVLCAHFILDESISYLHGFGIAIMLMAIIFMNWVKPVKILKTE